MSERVNLKGSAWREASGLQIALNTDEPKSVGLPRIVRLRSEALSGLKKYKNEARASEFRYRTSGNGAAVIGVNRVPKERRTGAETLARALTEQLMFRTDFMVESPARATGRMADRTKKLRLYAPGGPLSSHEVQKWETGLRPDQAAHAFADAHPLGTRIVDFRDYAEAHSDALVSRPDEFIPLHWHGAHTMRDALPLYVANKVPVSALQEAIDLGYRVEVHGTYPEEFKSVARTLGFDRVGRIPFKIHPEQKRHNYVRPQYFWARKSGKPVLVAAVTPGKDYVYHYAEMIRYALTSRGADADGVLSVTRYPTVERNIAHWTGLNETFIKKNDRVIFGNFDTFEEKMTRELGAAHLGTEENDFYSSSRYLLKDGSTINFLGVKYSYWGNASVPLIRQASRLGAREIIYAAKLGTLTSPDDVYKRIFMPSEYVIARHDKIVGKTRHSPNRVLAANPAMNSGVHSSVPTILEESSYQRRLLREERANTIDNEISQMAAEVMRQNRGKRYTPITFSAVHFATDYLHDTADGENIAMNLATNRTPETRAAKAEILQHISDTLTEYFSVPLDKSPEPARTFQAIEIPGRSRKPEAGS